MQEIWLGDCLNLMSNIESKSIDFILCDLPYGTTQCEWDSCLDLNLLWEQYKRIIKNNGCICLFSQTPYDKILGVSNIEWLKYEWIWEKSQATGFLNAKKMPMKSHENILVFYKNLPCYNPQKTTGHNPINSYNKKANIQNKTTIYGKVDKDISGGGDTDRYHRSVIKFSSDKQKMKNTPFLHPTQKPLKLCEYLIKTYTNENDIVLDNCAGSSTTLIASKNLNRQFIGIEKEEKYYSMCIERLKGNI